MGRTKSFNREDVLKCAIQLFWRKGYVDTSLSDLEKATGVNKSGLYSEFKDKDDIFLESLKYYKENSPVYSILSMEPLGWDNIARFLKSNTSCSGQKGCFLSNTMREFSIVPQKVRSLIEQSSASTYELILKNLEAAQIKQEPSEVAKLILTFASGIGLKLNAQKPKEVLGEIDYFMNFMKSSN